MHGAQASTFKLYWVLLVRAKQPEARPQKQQQLKDITPHILEARHACKIADSRQRHMLGAHPLCKDSKIGVQS